MINKLYEFEVRRTDDGDWSLSKEILNVEEKAKIYRITDGHSWRTQVKKQNIGKVDSSLYYMLSVILTEDDAEKARQAIYIHLLKESERLKSQYINSQAEHERFREWMLIERSKEVQ